MKAVILAAGQGARLRPLTDDRPQCMVPYQGRPLLEHIARALRDGGVDDIVVVRGYQPEALRCEGVRFYDNPDYGTTNRVHTLFCAARELRGDVVISSSNVVYSARVVRRLIESPAELAVAIARQPWLWRERPDELPEDAETLRLDARGNVVELGRRARSYSEVEGQYVGLMKVEAPAWPRLHAFYAALDRNADYGGKDFENMSMQSFIQAIIARLMPVKAVPVDGGWLAIDAPSDLEIAVDLRA